MLDENFLKSLNNQCTRDLYWLLASECPLNPKVDLFRLFPEEILIDIVDQHKSYLVKLDENTTEFQAYLTKRPTRRLGIYAERLLAFFFKDSPQINLITHNLQVIRNGETLGEIDFIIEWKGELYHIELAIKYYLGVDDLSEFKNWIGPSGNDNLAKKLDKVLTHQLALSKEPEVTDIIHNRRLSSFFFLKGKFYFNEYKQLPNWINSSAPRGKYSLLSDSTELLMKRCHSHILRPNWLSDLTYLQSTNLNRLDLQNMEQLIIENGGLHLVVSDYPVQTNFVVLDSWPEVK